MNPLEDFTLYIRGKGYSDVYITPLKKYLNYCASYNIDYLVITLQNLKSYISYLKDNNMTIGTINNHIKSIRCFYKYLVENNKVSSDIVVITRQISLSKISKKKQDYFSKNEIDALIDLSGTLLNINIVKIKPLFHFIFYTEISNVGLLQLKRENINLKECSAIIKLFVEKWHEKKVFFPRIVSNEIKVYFKHTVENSNAFNIGKGELKKLCGKLNNLIDSRYFNSYTLRYSFNKKKQVKGRYNETK